MAPLAKAVVVGGNRTPFARAGGALAEAQNQDLLTAALDGLVARFGLAGERLDEVAGGAVLKHPRELNLTREAVLGSALDPATPAVDLQQACATGLETAIYLANKISLHQARVGIAAGVDSASNPPITVSDGLRQALSELYRARSGRERWRALSRIRPADLVPLAPRVTEPRTGRSMGEHQAATTATWQISRQAQDEFTLRSHQRLAAAWEAGFFNDLVTAHLGLRRDALLRPDANLAALGALPAVFGDTMTAGNSTALTDGAAATLLAEADWASARGLPAWAWIVDAQVAAVDFAAGEDLLLAPVQAIATLLARQQMALADFEVIEIHEAFAATVLATLEALESPTYCGRLGLPRPLGSINPERLNRAGSSLATGHPFAATGARILATGAKLAHQLGAGARALLSVCAAGGQGVVMIVEAL